MATMLARYKTLKIGFILAAGLCLAQQAMALGLGELVLESSLSEPLDATVELQDVAGLDPSQISVTLGTANDFAGAGIELSELAEQVQFAVEVDGAAGRIHLTTPAAVEEPFLDLLLVVSWPGGTVQRDYTVLLNLARSPITPLDSLAIPGSTGQPPAAAESTQANNNETSNGTSLSDDGQTYAVAEGDSMWAIAARTRPSADIGMHQMMLAIQRANEGAFINNDINRVLAGRVLRIPSLEEINLVDQDTAIAQLNQSNQQLAAQPLAVNRSAGNANPAPEQDELTVLTDDQATAAGAGGSGGGASTLAALESEMMLSEENLDRARLENAELTSRFKMLEEEMDLLQNLIVMEDTRIAQLQTDLAAQAETAEQALAATEAATSVMAAQQSEPQAGVAGNVEGWLQNTAVLMGVIVALLLLVLGYLFWQRQRMDAAVYAFDSGIPELETVENSTFAPVAKTGSGLMGWFSRSGNKAADKDSDGIADSNGSVASSSMSLRNDATGMAEPGNIAAAGDAARQSYYVDEEHLDEIPGRSIAAGSFGNEGASSQASWNEEGTAAFGAGSAGSSQINRTITTVDEAELADALIAEAQEIKSSSEERVVSHLDREEAAAAEAMEEAHALAELVTPDVAMTEATIPESFEFTLKTAPEALAEEASDEAVDDLESFDFQLSDVAAAGKDKAASASDEDADLNALLLDEDESDFQSAPLNECDTKLDLAVAYEAMGDIEGAVEILDEVIADGDRAQIAEANRLKGLWRNS